MRTVVLMPDSPMRSWASRFSAGVSQMARVLAGESGMVRKPRRPWPTVMAPAIQLASQGFVLSEDEAHTLRSENLTPYATVVAVVSCSAIIKPKNHRRWPAYGTPGAGLASLPRLAPVVGQNEWHSGGVPRRSR